MKVLFNRSCHVDRWSKYPAAVQNLRMRLAGAFPRIGRGPWNIACGGEPAAQFVNKPVSFVQVFSHRYEVSPSMFEHARSCRSISALMLSFGD